jgi:hypothetical protein
MLHFPWKPKFQTFDYKSTAEIIQTIIKNYFPKALVRRSPCNISREKDTDTIQILYTEKI